jgi:hypothetical protein
MNTNKALWEKGDFTRLAESMRERGSFTPASPNRSITCAEWEEAGKVRAIRSVLVVNGLRSATQATDY